MIKPTILSIIALLVGAVIGNNWINTDSSGQSSDTAALFDHFQMLEQRLDYETLKREELEKSLAQHEQLCSDQLEKVSETGTLTSNNTLRTADGQVGFPTGRDSYDAQINELTEAGFSLEEAQRIAELESQVQQTIFTARLENRSISPRGIVLEFQDMLRDELGDDQYALYLETRGRPTNVEVMEVIESSAGKAAGLENGDKILSYDGERVFSILDLQRLTQDGIEGQTVVMEIDRDGIPITLAIPRGQIGISSGDFGFRGRGRN